MKNPQRRREIFLGGGKDAEAVAATSTIRGCLRVNEKRVLALLVGDRVVADKLQPARRQLTIFNRRWANIGCPKTHCSVF